MADDKSRGKDNVVSIRKHRPHWSLMALCLDCFNKWIAVVPHEVNPFKLTCPLCGKNDSFASFIPKSYAEHGKQKT